MLTPKVAMWSVHGNCVINRPLNEPSTRCLSLSLPLSLSVSQVECGLSSVRLLGLTDGPDALPKALAEALISSNAEKW